MKGDAKGSQLLGLYAEFLQTVPTDRHVWAESPEAIANRKARAQAISDEMTELIADRGDSVDPP